jgi:hypothetical protein
MVSINGYTTYQNTTDKYSIQHLWQDANYWDFLPEILNITITGNYVEGAVTDDLMFYVTGEFEGFYQTNIRYCPDNYDELYDTVKEILNQTGGSGSGLSMLLATVPSSDSSLLYTQYILLPEGRTLNVGDLILHTDGVVKQIT